MHGHMTDELVVSGLSVHYGGVRAVNSVSFTVGAGECVGIIGANGAGQDVHAEGADGAGAEDRGRRSGSATTT